MNTTTVFGVVTDSDKDCYVQMEGVKPEESSDLAKQQRVDDVSYNNDDMVNPWKQCRLQP